MTTLVVIEVDGLSKRFGKTQAVAGLSFRVEPGTITGFLGPNGAGKSTTLRSVLGLVHPDAGSATVLGVPYGELDRPLHRVGAVLEASEVHPGRSGRNHLRVQAAAAGIPASRVDEVLALVDLTAAGEAARQGLLARDAPAARARDGAARRSGGARARRAGERARPRRDQVAARLPPRARGRGPHDPRLEPRALRGRADRRPGRDHPPRQADPAGGDGRRARRRDRRDAGADAGRGSGCASCSPPRA